METLVSRNCARSCQLNERHTLHPYPPSIPRPVPSLRGNFPKVWMVGGFSRPCLRGCFMPCQGAQLESDLVLHCPGVRLPASNDSCLRPRICSWVLMKPLFHNLLLKSFSILFDQVIHAHGAPLFPCPVSQPLPGRDPKDEQADVCVRTWAPPTHTTLLTGIRAPSARGSSLLWSGASPRGAGGPRA